MQFSRRPGSLFLGSIVAGSIPFFAGISGSVEEPTYDFVLRNGRVVDGSGNPGFHADVGVKGGRIAAIGRGLGKGPEEFDVTGSIVAPGFIDVHTHAEDVDDHPLAENFLRMGVTTVVMGNCGASALNIAEYFAHVEATTISPNIATLVGLGTVRRAAMGGSYDRVPTADELDRMRTVVRRGMDEGAVGVSTGLIYLPGVFAKTEEIIELAKVAASYDGIYATHQRSESTEIFQSLDEIFSMSAVVEIAGVRGRYTTSHTSSNSSKRPFQSSPMTSTSAAYCSM